MMTLPSRRAAARKALREDPPPKLSVVDVRDPVPARLKPWAQAGGVLVYVTGLGIAHFRPLGVPGWLGIVFVVLGCVMAAGGIPLPRRADPQALEPLPLLNIRRPLKALPAPPPDEEDVSAAETQLTSSRLALGYTCVPTGGNAALADDADRIRAWCVEADLSLAKVVHDIEARTEGRGSRPALRWTLDQIATGEANTLVVARLRTLAPNVASLPRLLHWFTEAERRLVAIDLRLDTATDAGRLTASALEGVGSWENERLSARTRRGLEAARSRGAGRAGAAVADLPELRARIVRMRHEGMTLQAIADVLNEEGVPTLRGGAKWRPSSVHGATGYRRPTSARGIEMPDDSPGPRSKDMH
jgi:DNA invertase Pin-like site-specific DNA recombinase